MPPGQSFGGSGPLAVTKPDHGPHASWLAPRRSGNACGLSGADRPGASPGNNYRLARVSMALSWGWPEGAMAVTPRIGEGNRT